MNEGDAACQELTFSLLDMHTPALLLLDIITSGFKRLLGVHAEIKNAVSKLLVFWKRPGRECGVTATATVTGYLF